MKLKEFEQAWLAHFAEGVPQKQLEARVTSRGNCLWHLFSRELLPEGSYLVGDDAREAYNHLRHEERERALFIEPFSKERETFSLTWLVSSAYHLDQRPAARQALCPPRFYRRSAHHVRHHPLLFGGLLHNSC